MASRMAESLAHRGPDDRGVWADPETGVSLGHRRLAIIDLSPAGHQPMISPSGRFVLTYNGEIYNFEELRAELLGLGERFVGHSDTEVLLRALERWGVHAALRRTNGMFAFGLWDRAERELILGRDRLGEKPLFYGWMGAAFLFGSELKALRQHRAFQADIDRDALAEYLRHGFIPAPRSIYQGIRKLTPGTTIRVRPGDAGSPPRPVPFWSLDDDALRSDIATGLTEDETLQHLDALLADAVRLRTRADVPLGAFLSGGIDSSLVVALMCEGTSKQIRTFTIGFEEAEYDESRPSAEVAAALGTEHTTVTVSPADALATVPSLPTVYDEPFGDSSQIPTMLLSKLTRSAVTVSLSGDGGDEVFGGYNRYTWCRPVWSSIRWIPHGARSWVAGLLDVAPSTRWDAWMNRAAPALPARLRVRTPGTKIQKLSGVMPARNIDELYELLISHWKPGESIVLGADILSGATRRAPIQLESVENMMYTDTLTELPDDMLVKVDRASMHASLETRVPLLDHRIVEFAWSLPLSMKIRAGVGKWAPRQLLYRRLPQEIVDRPKAGFGVPLDSWLRGPLRDWAGDLLSERRLKSDGYLDPEPVLRVWTEHLQGRRDRQDQLWDVLMFQAWLDSV